MLPSISGANDMQIRLSASDALAELLRYRPDLTLSFVRDRLPTTDTAYRENLFDGLRKAGLPE